MRYAAWEARLSKCDEHGTPPRAHLRAAAKKNSAIAIKELEGPRFPLELSYLWYWFLELRQGVGSGMDGGSLTWVCVDAWARRMRRELEPYEFSALFSLDAAFRDPRSVEVAA